MTKAWAITHLRQLSTDPLRRHVSLGSAAAEKSPENRQKLANRVRFFSHGASAFKAEIRSWAPCSKHPMGMKFSLNSLRVALHTIALSNEISCVPITHTLQKKTSPQVSVAAAIVAVAARFCGRSDHGTLRLEDADHEVVPEDVDIEAAHDDDEAAGQDAPHLPWRIPLDVRRCFSAHRD